MKTERKTDSRLFFCPECSKGFGRKGDLKRHQDLHDGHKPYICDHPGCGKTFSQASGLKTHKNVHTRERPYVCGFDSCPAAFGDPSSCARHRKETHRRVGGYRCPHPRCNSKIKRRSAFTAHLKRHRIDPVSVDIDSLAPPLLPVAIPVSRRKASERQVDFTPKIKEMARTTSARETRTKLHYRYLERFSNPPLVLEDACYSGDSDNTGSYSDSVPSSVVSPSPYYATPSSEFEPDAVDGFKWEDHVDRLYTMEPSSSPTNVNMFNSPPPSPPRSFSAPAQAGAPSGAPYMADDLEFFYAVNSFAAGFNGSYLLPPPCYYEYTAHDTLPARRVAELSSFVCDPAPETSWAFA